MNLHNPNAEHCYCSQCRKARMDPTFAKIEQDAKERKDRYVVYNVLGIIVIAILILLTMI